MLKQTSITDAYEDSQTITTTGNIYLSSGNVEKFLGISQNRLIRKINNNSFIQDGNSKIELFKNILPSWATLYFWFYMGFPHLYFYKLKT